MTRKSAIAVMLLLSPLFFFFVHLGDLRKAGGSWACAGILVLTVRSRWDLRNRIWFWILTVFLALLQIPFILFFPWENKHLSYVGLLPAGALDYVIMYGSIKLAEKLTARGV